MSEASYASGIKQGGPRLPTHGSASPSLIGLNILIAALVAPPTLPESFPVPYIATTRPLVAYVLSAPYVSSGTRPMQGSRSVQAPFFGVNAPQCPQVSVLSLAPPCSPGEMAPNAFLTASIAMDTPYSMVSFSRVARVLYVYSLKHGNVQIVTSDFFNYLCHSPGASAISDGLSSNGDMGRDYTALLRIESAMQI